MKKIYTIGREESCDIVIPDQTDVVSRLHATLRIDSKGKYFLNDQSRNGTYINGMKMASNVEVPVSRKDVVSFAHIYNLDWTQIPKQNNRWNIGIIALLCIALMTAAIYATLKYLKKTPIKDTPTSGQQYVPSNTPINNTPINDTDSVGSDSIALPDSVKEEVKEQPKNEKGKKVKEEKVEEHVDSVLEEQQEDEIYNPIY